MLWVKSLHLVFMVTWFAGLFYLPRLFVYHALAEDRFSIERFKLMERKLFWGIMTPGAVLTIAFGLWLWLGWFRGAFGGWFHAKLALVLALTAYHVWLAGYAGALAKGERRLEGKRLRLLNEVPGIAAALIVVLVIVRPF